MSIPLATILTALFWLLSVLIVVTALVTFTYFLIRNCIESTEALRQRRKQYEMAKQRRTELREENYRQQLQKSTFQSRLEKFSAGCHSDQKLASKMRYWQAEDLELKNVPPKPIEFIRMALMRLSKLFRGN